MIRSEIIAKAARRLGDTSQPFLDVLDDFFDDILGDLAQAEAISDLIEEAAFDIIEDQESYSSQTICGLTGVYPLRILKIHVPSWGLAGTAPGFRRAENNAEYEQMRQAGDELRGTAKFWRTYPNSRQVQLWPPADADNAGTGIGRVVYLRAPSTFLPQDDVTDIRAEDIETVVWGLVSRGAPFRDETLADTDHALEMYERGKQIMWSRSHTEVPQRVVARDF